MQLIYSYKRYCITINLNLKQRDESWPRIVYIPLSLIRSKIISCLNWLCLANNILIKLWLIILSRNTCLLTNYNNVMCAYKSVNKFKWVDRYQHWYVWKLVLVMHTSYISVIYYFIDKCLTSLLKLETLKLKIFLINLPHRS